MGAREDQYRKMLREFGPALQRLCRSYEADPARRDELRQEILLGLWRALEGFRGDASVRTFVYRVAHNVAIKHVASNAQHRAPDIDPVEVPSPERLVDRKRARERLEQRVRALPPLDRELVLLYLEGVPTREIAEVTGLSGTNVTTRLSRLRARLEQEVRDGR